MKKIISFFTEVLTARKKIKELEAKLSSPSKVIENILGRGITWFDFDKLDGKEKLAYYIEIQKILQNDSLSNEINHYIGDLVQEIAYSEADLNRDKMLRFSINGIKALVERLESIRDPRKLEASMDEVNEVV